jgi:hypothetical protein
MKRILTIVLALGLGGAAFADDAEKKPAAEATAAPAPEVTATPAASDSPMVAAAKRARKGRKASIVITNDTLNKSGAGAHVTTTAKQPAFATAKEPLRPTPEMVYQQQREAEKRRQTAQAEKQKQAAETQEQATAAAAAMAEEGLYDAEEHDPAQAEKTQEDANKKPPQR